MLILVLCLLYVCGLALTGLHHLGKDNPSPRKHVLEVVFWLPYVLYVIGKALVKDTWR